MNAELAKARAKSLEKQIELIKAEGVDGAESTVEAYEAELGLLRNFAAPPPPAPKQLVSDAKLERYVQFALNGKTLNGAEKELSDEVGLSHFESHFTDLAGGVAVPLELLQFANEVDLTAGDYSTNVQPALPRVFNTPDLSFLAPGAIRSVPAGEARYPVLTAGATGSHLAKGASVANTEATFTVKALNPLRVSAMYTWRIEDVYSWGSNSLERALRQDLRSTLGEALENSAMNGSGTAPQPTGVLATFTTAAETTHTSTHPLGKAKVVPSVDGKHAGGYGDLRVLMGASTFAQYDRLFRTTSAPGSLIQELSARGMSFKVSARIPKHSSNKNENMLIVAASAAQNLVVPVWNAFLLVRDSNTLAAAGETRIVAHLLHSVSLRATGGWRTVDIKFAA